jgi:hypothetical protein
MNDLYRELAPIPAEAWEAIDQEAKRALIVALAARKIVDFVGPLGWAANAAGLGRTKALAESPSRGVKGALRTVQPLVELRASFELARSELDAVARGAKDPDLDAVRAAWGIHQLVNENMASAARIHAVDAGPSDVLPLRGRSLDDADLGEMTGPSAALLLEAAAVLGAAPPDGPSGLVHGDLWHGNTLWQDGVLTGTVDWDYAGVGPAGVDLGGLRCDAAVLFGATGPAEVLAGWEAERGAAATDVAWWDAVAATATPADMGLWLPEIHAQGRTDLDAATMSLRRDAFLTAALRELT